jgi:hypothetical protein
VFDVPHWKLHWNIISVIKFIAEKATFLIFNSLNQCINQNKMKKLLQTLVLILMAQVVSAQMPCQAAFTYNFSNPGSLYLYDASYNLDSTQINVSSYMWTVQALGAMQTYTWLTR